MSTVSEIKKAILTLKSSGTRSQNIYILHCHSNYPSSFKDLNLNNMLTLKKKLNCKIGFSDHSIGNLASIVASSLGAEVIEKHVTLNNNLNGSDHSSSLNVKDLKNFVDRIRNVNLILGDKKIRKIQDRGEK